MYSAYLEGNGQVLFESDPLDYSDAFVIEPEGLTGVFDTPATKGESVDRVAAHGSFDLPTYLADRFPAVKGTVLARSEMDLLQKGNLLRGVLAGTDGVLTVAAPGGSWRVRVKLSGVVRFSPHPSGLEADFQIGMKAVNPRMFGESRSVSGGSVTVHHYGNFPADPVIEVTGQRSNPYTITGPGGRVVTVTQSLTVSQTHRIDFADGGLYRNGVRQLGQMTHFQPWTIPPGTRVPMSISSGSMTVTVTDTYM